MQIDSLLGLAAGFVLFLLLLVCFERDFSLVWAWVRRVVSALALGLILWKLTPIWTRWDAVFDNPLLLISMNGGLAAILGGLFAFLTAVALSLTHLRKERPKARRWPLMAPVAAGLVLVGIWAFAEPLVVPRPGSEPGSAVQMLVPDLGGQNHALADWKGKVLVVNFWTSGCLPCEAELPEFRTFTQKMSAKMVLVGVNLLGSEKDGAPGVLKYVVKNKLSWTQLSDPTGMLQKAFAVTSVPTTVVLDPDGKVVDRREGPVDAFWLKTLEFRFAR